MAINFMDNFNIYGTDAGRTARLLNGVYADNFGGTLQVDPDASAGGNQVLRIDAGGTGTFVRKTLPSPKVTVGVAARYYLSTLALSDGRDGDGAILLALSDSSAIQHCYVGVDASGYVRAFRSVNGPSSGDVALAASAGPVVVADAWQHIETKIVLDAAAGSIEVRIEGVTVLTVSGVKTTSDRTGAGNTAGNVLFKMPTSSSCEMYVKDFIIWDSTGGVNNNFLGTCQVVKIIPDADVALNWSPFPADGIGYNKINEVTPDDDSSYISAPFPIPAAYKCSLSDLPVTVTSVKGVMPIHRSRKTDAGDGNIQIGAISGGSTGLGVDRPVTTTYTYYWDVFDSDPNIAGPWTRLSVNAMNLQINRTL